MAEKLNWSMNNLNYFKQLQSQSYQLTSIIYLCAFCKKNERTELTEANKQINFTNY